MSTTSKKHDRFCAETMQDKSVTALPGIGKVLGANLRSFGYDDATQVYGKLLSFNNDQVQFENWLKDEIGANSKQRGDCFYALTEWKRLNH